MKLVISALAPGAGAGVHPSTALQLRSIQRGMGPSTNNVFVHPMD